MVIASLTLALQQSLAEVQQLRAKTLASPTEDAPGLLLKDSSGGGCSSKNSSFDTDDFVMVPVHFPSKRILIPQPLSGVLVALQSVMCIESRGCERSCFDNFHSEGIIAV